MEVVEAVETVEGGGKRWRQRLATGWLVVVGGER